MTSEIIEPEKIYQVNIITLNGRYSTEMVNHEIRLVGSLTSDLPALFNHLYLNYRFIAGPLRNIQVLFSEQSFVTLEIMRGNDEL